MQVHDSVKEYAEQKAQKLERFADSLQKVEIVLSSRGDEKVVEMIIVPRRGQRIVGQAEHEDQFPRGGGDAKSPGKRALRGREWSLAGGLSEANQRTLIGECPAGCGLCEAAKEGYATGRENVLSQGVQLPVAFV